MKRLCTFLFFLVTTASAQVSLKPKVDRQSSDDTFITKVELTPEYTILTLRFSQRVSPSQQRLREQFPEFFADPSFYTISIDPDSYLRATLDGVSETFKFVKAVGIPLKPQRRRVQPGDVVSFLVYYERLKPGMELFTLYECQSDEDFTCWNFYGVHVSNPRKRTAKPPARPSTPAPKKPATPVAPKSQPAKPVEKEILLTGQVFDARTKQPIDGRLVFRKARERVDSARTIGGLGVYRNSVKPGTYEVTVTAEGHQPLRATLNVAGSPAEVDKDFYLEPLAPTSTPPPPAPTPTIPDDEPAPLETAEVGSKLTLKSIGFEMSKATLQPASFGELNRLVAAMKENPALEIRLEGHTDQVGDPAKNQQLSVERVVAVKRYLVSKGIAPERIQTKGFGDTRPVTSGRSETDRSRNRRVEVIILKK
jgi:outer membrane protein OmpA-like peptidoglycan-associated protein